VMLSPEGKQTLASIQSQEALYQALRQIHPPLSRTPAFGGTLYGSLQGLTQLFSGPGVTKPEDTERRKALDELGLKRIDEI